MRDIRRYWSDRRTIEASLPEFLWLAAGESTPVQVSAAVAAGLLQARTHRIATEEEVRRELVRARDVTTQQKRTQLRKHGIAVVGMPDAPSESDTIRA
jgi:hypothetical protein